MFSFIKKIFGFPTEEEKASAVAQKLDVVPPLVNNKTGDIVEEVKVVSTSVNDQITDSVTQAAEPAKKTRKPRAPKAEKPAKEKVVKEKAAKARKPAAEKTTKRSKKA